MALWLGLPQPLMPLASGSTRQAPRVRAAPTPLAIPKGCIRVTATQIRSWPVTCRPSAASSPSFTTFPCHHMLSLHTRQHAMPILPIDFTSLVTCNKDCTQQQHITINTDPVPQQPPLLRDNYEDQMVACQYFTLLCEEHLVSIIAGNTMQIRSLYKIKHWH